MTADFDCSSVSVSSSFSEGGGIRFPDKYGVLESYDNMEWLTGAVLAIDSATLQQFIRNNKFDTARNLSQAVIAGNGYLKQFPAAFNTAENIYFLTTGSAAKA